MGLLPRHRLAATAAFSALALTARSQAAGFVCAAEVASQIRASGAKAVLATLYDSEAWSESISPGIASGSLAWLHVAEKFKAVADGATAQDIDAGLMDSLASAPLRVLPELTRLYGEAAEEICNLSFEAALPKPDVATHVLGMRKKFGAAKTARAKALASACNCGLDESVRRAAEQGLL